MVGPGNLGRQERPYTRASRKNRDALAMGRYCVQGSGNPAETPEGHWDSDFDWSSFDGNEAYDTAGVAAADAAAAAAAADGAGAAVADGAAAAANDEADAGESDGAAAAADDEADAGESDGDEAEEMVGEGEADSEADKELCLAITR